MKKKISILAIIYLSCITLFAQTSFNNVVVQGWVGTGQHEVMFVLDYDSDSTGTDSVFAWGIRFDTDSISGDTILNRIAAQFSNFTYDYSGGFLNNIQYNYNSILYTNPNAGWFSVLESYDGIQWQWNNGLSDYVGNNEWFGIVVMNPSNYDAYINVPLITNVNQVSKVKIHVYPNPCTNYLYIENISDYTVSIINSNGRVVCHKKDAGNKLNLSYLKTGIYTLIIQSDLTKISKKLIIN